PAAPVSSKRLSDSSASESDSDSSRNGDDTDSESGADDVKSAANGNAAAVLSSRTKDQSSSKDLFEYVCFIEDELGPSGTDSGNRMNETNNRQASFHLGGNDDDLSNDSQPRTSPTSKSIGENDPLKRNSSLSKLTGTSALKKKDNPLTLAAMAASTSTSSTAVKPDDKVAQDRFMQYQKQAKLKAEQEKLYKEQEAKKREDEAKQARLSARKETNGNHSNDTIYRNSTNQNSTSTLSDASPSPPSNLQNSLSSSSINPSQDAPMDDKQRQKQEIARRREEDRRRRECQALNQSLPFNRHDVDFSFMK
ncbi:unnamed protein product, partial [Adineta ricciae]